MNLYEREYFVARLRSGVYNVRLDNVLVTIKTPTIFDTLHGEEIFLEKFNEFQKEGILTEDEIEEWMIDKKLWTTEQEESIAKTKKDIETLKVQIYEQRSHVRQREGLRRYLRAAETVLAKLQSEKSELKSRTCENMAFEAKTLAVFERCCYVGKELLDFEYVDLNSLYIQYNLQNLKEADLRELARNDPWRLHWTLKDHNNLFANEPDRELTNDQKGILIWSNMYDNIQESMDCPTEDVIEDDDMLDGWFIVQRKKQQANKAQSELESRTKNEKIANSDEIMIVTDSNQEIENIHGMNNHHGEIVRRERMAQIKRAGKLKDDKFNDRQLEIRAQQNQALKDRMRR